MSFTYLFVYLFAYLFLFLFLHLFSQAFEPYDPREMGLTPHSPYFYVQAYAALLAMSHAAAGPPALAMSSPFRTVQLPPPPPQLPPVNEGGHWGSFAGEAGGAPRQGGSPPPQAQGFQSGQGPRAARLRPGRPPLQLAQQHSAPEPLPLPPPPLPPMLVRSSWSTAPGPLPQFEAGFATSASVASPLRLDWGMARQVSGGCSRPMVMTPALTPALNQTPYPTLGTPPLHAALPTVASGLTSLGSGREQVSGLGSRLGSGLGSGDLLWVDGASGGSTLAGMPAAQAADDTVVWAAVHQRLAQGLGAAGASA